MRPLSKRIQETAEDVTIEVLTDVGEERHAQDKKWGQQNHAFPMWLAIFMEEVGEISKDYLDANLDPKSPGEALACKKNMRTEMVQTAAVMVAMIECGDRNGWFE